MSASPGSDAGDAEALRDGQFYQRRAARHQGSRPLPLYLRPLLRHAIGRPRSRRGQGRAQGRWGRYARHHAQDRRRESLRDDVQPQQAGPRAGFSPSRRARHFERSRGAMRRSGGELPAWHAGGDGAGLGCVARTQSQAGRGSHLRLRTGRTDRQSALFRCDCPSYQRLDVDDRGGRWPTDHGGHLYDRLRHRLVWCHRYTCRPQGAGAHRHRTGGGCLSAGQRGLVPHDRHTGVSFARSRGQAQRHA